MSNQPRIGDLLVEAGAITHLQLSDALQHQRERGGRLGTNLVELGFIDEKTLAMVLARQLSIPSVTAAQLERCTATALRLLPAGVAERLRAVPLREDQGKLWVAMADPTDAQAVGELTRATGLPIRPMVAPELLIQYALERHYKVQRKPRVVQVRTGESDLLHLDAQRPHPTAPAPAPVWDPMGNAPLAQEAESFTGYLDEQPAAPPKVPVLSRKEVVAQLLSAATDDAVFEVALRYVAADVQRLALLVLQKGRLRGWRGQGLDLQALRAVNVALDEAPAVARGLASAETRVGRLYPHELGALAVPLGVATEALGVVLPVSIGKRAVAVLVGLGAAADVARRKPDLDWLATKVDQALHINYLRRTLQQVDG